MLHGRILGKIDAQKMRIDFLEREIRNLRERINDLEVETTINVNTGFDNGNPFVPIRIRRVTETLLAYLGVIIRREPQKFFFEKKE